MKHQVTREAGFVRIRYDGNALKHYGLKAREEIGGGRAVGVDIIFSNVETMDYDGLGLVMGWATHHIVVEMGGYMKSIEVYALVKSRELNPLRFSHAVIDHKVWGCTIAPALLRVYVYWDEKNVEYHLPY